MKWMMCAILAVLFFAAGCEGFSVPKLPSLTTGLRHAPCLPSDQFAQGWRRVGKERSYRGSKLVDLIGAQAAQYQSYGVDMAFVADYAYMKNELPSLAIEVYQMNNGMAASGIFHYHRGTKLRGQGVPVDVGVEGVRNVRVLYFYKDIYFIKLIYTGGVPAPDLDAMGRIIADSIPGEARPPRGFEYLAVEGVDVKTSTITQGFTFRYDFLPPSIMAAAPGAGDAAQIFLMTHYEDKDAQATARDYRFFLERNGLDYSLKRTRDRRMIWMANDPNVGKVYATQYKQWVIGVSNPDNYERAEVLVERVLELMRR